MTMWWTESEPTKAADHGGVRPYLRVESASLLLWSGGNVNDNWLTYFQSVLPRHAPEIGASQQTRTVVETATITLRCDNANGSSLSNLSARVTLPTGRDPFRVPLSKRRHPSVTSDNCLDSQQPKRRGQPDYTMNVQLDTARRWSCQPSNLSMIRAECQGTNGGDSYAMQRCQPVAGR